MRELENGVRATSSHQRREVTFWNINFAKVSNFGKVCTPKSDISEKSEGNGEIQKVVERDFGEKRL